MAGIERLEGVWNIVPTPFPPTAPSTRRASRGLTRFVAGCGVDGMTILGVLGEAAKLSDDERGTVIDGVVAAAGDLPVCVGVSHAATDRAVAFAREAAGHGRALGDARAAGPRPAERRRGPRPLPRRRRAVDLPVVVQDHPASSGVHMTRRAAGDDRRAGADLPGRQARGRAESAEGRPAAAPRPRASAILGGLGAIMLLEELRRGAVGTMTGFGFPELLVEIVARSGPATRRRPGRFHRILPLIRFENQPGINLAIRKHLYRRRGAIASERVRAPGPASTRAPSPTSTPCSRRRPRRPWRRPARPRLEPAPAADLRQRPDHPAVDRHDGAGDVRRRGRQQERRRPGRARAGRRSVRAGSARSSGAGSPRPDTPALAARAASSWAIRSVASRPGRQPVDPDRGDLLDQRLDEPGQPRPDEVRGRQAGDRLADRARQDDQDGRVATLAQVRQGGAQQPDRRSTACRRWRAARPPRRGPRTDPAAGRRS